MTLEASLDGLTEALKAHTAAMKEFAAKTIDITASAESLAPTSAKDPKLTAAEKKAAAEEKKAADDKAAAEAKAKAAAAAADGPTQQDAKTALGNFLKVDNDNEELIARQTWAVELLGSYGAQKASNLDEKYFVEFIDKVNAELAKREASSGLL